MSKIKSLDELQKFRERIMDSANTYAAKTDRVVLAVGMATCGAAAGAGDTMKALTHEIEKRKLTNVVVIPTGCYGYCYAEPMVEVRVPGEPPVRYGNVDASRAREIIDQHVINGKPIEDAVIRQEVLRP